MPGNYEKIISDNLFRFYSEQMDRAEHLLPAQREKKQFHFKAFGEDCVLSPEGITFSGVPEKGPKALLISLYALHINPEPLQQEPFKSFKDFPNTMPYWGAFSANSERVLVPFVNNIKTNVKIIKDLFEGRKSPENISGDFSFVIRPLPKISLCYIFYLPDEDFPASCTCLFSSNADSFMPLDGLADVGEYSSRKIREICR